MKRLLPLAAVVLAAGVAALAVNLLLVDYASGRDDRVGTLSPRASLPDATTGETTRTTGGTTGGGTTTDDGATGATTTEGDDDRGRGRGRNRGRGGDGSEDDD